MVYVICLIIGVMTALVGSLMGLGGGIVLIPSLLFLHQHVAAFSWATPQMIVGVSLMVMVFTAISSATSYYRHGRVDVRTGLLFLTGCIPGGVLGSWLNQYVDVDQFTLYFGVLMVVLSFMFLLKRKQPSWTNKTDKNVRVFKLDNETYYYKVTLVPAFILSFIVGVLSGLFGIGGGSITVPAMIILFSIPAHIATATSMFLIGFISLTTVSTHIVLGHIAWGYVLFFIPGAWFGAKLGVRLNKRLKGNTLEWILRVLLIIMGIRLIIVG